MLESLIGSAAPAYAIGLNAQTLTSASDVIRQDRCPNAPPPRGCEETGMPAFVQVFGCRDGGTIQALRWPAPEKRQGTKSRDVGGGSAAGAMGIWPGAQVRL